MAVLLGCIADDFTGGTDLAGMLVKHGMRTVQMIGVPERAAARGRRCGGRRAQVAHQPGRRGGRASRSPRCAGCRSAGCRQFYFKYCSTFDSTPAGNIGPVAEALMEALGTDFTIACPAFPANGRTIFKGYLFVGDVLLSESGMRNHPLTPMTDANLVRVLQQQVQRKVGLVDYAAVARGADAIARALRGVARARAAASRSSMRSPISDLVASVRPAPICRSSPPDRAWRSACPKISAAAGCWRKELAADALPATRRLARGHCRQLLDRHPGAGRDDARASSGLQRRPAAPRRAASDVVSAALGWAA